MKVGALRIERRVSVPGWASFIVPFASAAGAMAIMALLLAASGEDPLSVYTDMFDSAFVGADSLSATLTSATPILLTGLAIAISFRMKAWNLGGEGQVYVAAAAAAAVGIALGNSAGGVAVLAMIAAGAVAGALWLLGPAILRIRFHTTELLTTLMLNYVAGLFIVYMIFSSESYLRDTSPAAAVYPQGKEIGEASFWPSLALGEIEVPLGFLLGLACAVLLFVCLRFTRFGFFIRVIGDAPDTAGYSGIRTNRVFLVVMLVSGALCGLAGASQIGDFSHTLEPRGMLSAQYAWTGVVVALIASLNPLGVVFSAFAVGGLRSSAFELQTSELPSGLVGTMEGLILLFIAIGLVLVHFRVTTSPVTAQDRKAGDRSARVQPIEAQKEANL